VKDHEKQQKREQNELRAADSKETSFQLFRAGAEFWPDLEAVVVPVVVDEEY